VGTRRELMLMAHAAKQTLVSVETITNDNLLENAEVAAGVIPSLYITALVEAPRGADPVGLFGCYDADQDALAHYANLARTDEGFQQHLEQLLK